MPPSRSPRIAAHARGPVVGLVTDRRDWHARSLCRAFANAGVEAFVFNLADCAIDTQSKPGVRISGFGDKLPDAVLVRDMSGGPFEAVTLRLGILHALSECGVPVWNTARAIERCVDKSMTSFLLTRAGIRTPDTWAMESPDAARAIVRREAAHGPLVLKPLFGSQGRGLRLIRREDDIPPSEATAGVYYLQRFVGVERDGFQDFRVLVSRGQVLAAMVRHASGWITNVKQGGRPVAAMPDAEMAGLALRATAAVGADFAGIDIIYGADDRPAVLEVNSMPAWSGLQRVTSVDIAAAIVAGLLALVGERTKHKAAV